MFPLSLLRAKESQVTALLKRVSLFTQLTTQELRRLEGILHERHYLGGELVFEQGDEGLGMYIVVKGKIEIVQTRKDGTRHVIAVLGPDEFFGELALLDPGARTAAAVATEDSILLGFFRPEFLSILEGHQAIGSKISYALARRVSERLRAVLANREGRASL
jgi:CRP-like cAMP-binding protein